MLSTAALLVPLFFTVPSTNPALDDSGAAICSVQGGPTRDLARVDIYTLSVRGGAYARAVSVNVRGREGTLDTALVPTDGAGFHAYAVAVDTIGNPSCVLGDLYVPGTITGVPDQPPVTPALVFYFDVQGRRYRSEPTASGIYWRVEILGNRRRVTRVVLLR